MKTKKKGFSTMNQGKPSAKMLVRPEQKEEFRRIREVIQEAFEPMPFSTGREWELVEKIRRSSGYIPGLALVANLEGNLVGHILISLVSLDAGKKEQDILLLGPVSVVPEWQRQGIGHELIRIGIMASRRLPLPVMVVVGDPLYYGRFGFQPAEEHGFRLPFGLDNSDFFQVLELKTGMRKGLGGTVKLPETFFDEKGDLL